jgi:hypothetical protein
MATAQALTNAEKGRFILEAMKQLDVRNSHSSTSTPNTTASLVSRRVLMGERFRSGPLPRVPMGASFFC